MKELGYRLQGMDGKPYGVYKNLARQAWPYGDLRLEFVHVQGDPYAPPSRILLRGRLQALGYNLADYENPLMAQALADFLLRRMHSLIQEMVRQNSSSERPSLEIVSPGPEILERNTVQIRDEHIYVLLKAQLPGEGRRIEAQKAMQLLLGQLAEISTEALYKLNLPEQAWLAHCSALEVQQALRAQLLQHNLVAFIGDGSILPRASGSSCAPLENAIPFSSPPTLRITLQHQGKSFTGMGVPRGVTVLAGGAFQGKSTVLKALEAGIYNHAPGDGRELVVTLPNASRVRVEEGRVVRGSDIRSLVRQIPGADVEKFITRNASGATSQAANLVEAVALGSTPLLIDEDASAVNFLVRDERMRALVGGEGEPIVPLVDQLHSMVKDWGVDFVIVAGACGDFLQVADTVVVLQNWQAREATDAAKKICEQSPLNKQGNANVKSAPRPLWNISLPVDPLAINDAKIKVGEGGIVTMGKFRADLSGWSALLCDEQKRLAATWAGILIKECQKKSEVDPLALLQKILIKGFDALPKERTGDYAKVRALEVAAFMLRLEEGGT